MDYRATILLYAELVLALFLLWREGILNTTARRVCGIIFVSLAFAFRYCVLTYETLDYQDWLCVWLQAFRDGGAWNALGGEIWSCNYNVPYLYFLAIISKCNVNDVLLIKDVSILFDVLMAWSVMRLVGLFRKNPAVRLGAFCGTLYLPTVFLNGALWGQCDVIYASFAVLAVYLLLANCPGWSIAAAAVSLSFKLQGIFLLPVYFVYLVAGRIKWKHILVFPLTYIITLLPAVIAGRNFWDLLLLYYNNTSSIGDGLNYNSSSMYALFNFDSWNTSTAAHLGIFLAAAFCLIVFAWTFMRRTTLDNRALLGLSVLFCVAIPFLLPHMHDRYFFMADALTFVLAFIEPKTTPAALMVSFGSLLGYHAYLKMRYLLPMRYGGLAMFAAFIIVLIFCILTVQKKIKALSPAKNEAPQAA